VTIADSSELLPPARGGNYEAARLNALRHGVLSQYTVLPWEGMLAAGVQNSIVSRAAKMSASDVDCYFELPRLSNEEIND
jgi:hypothetical protein